MLRAFLGRAGCPFLLRGFRRLDRTGRFAPAKIGNRADRVPPGRIDDGKGRTIIGLDPFARDIGFGGKKRRVFQQRAQIGDGIEHVGLLFNFSHAKHEARANVQFC